ncbi:DUF2828 family protein [Intestinibacter sp.]|uniref:DUF2828 family protein n=1 Tax=Intestinibacter sp. TaxID=1965304 RepID=UPI003F14AD46
MFEYKVNKLFGIGTAKHVEYTTSGNGSVKLTSTGDPFVDQFGLISQYRQLRPYSSVSKDMKTLWDIDPLYTLKLLFYIRLITRKVKLLDGTETSKVQKGAGLRHEAFMRMLWLAINHSEAFYKNLPLFITIGCWKDIIQLMSYDLQYHGWDNKVLDFDKLSDFILAGLENPNTCNLVKKFLPTIKARSKCTTLESQADTIIGKFLAHKLFGSGEFSPNLHSNNTYESYRKLKSSGTAHQWQQQISRSQFNIDFSKVHGRALALLVSGKYLANHGLEKDYENWIKKQPVAKFTGFVYELFKGLNNKSPLYKRFTIDKQFEGLIKTAKDSDSTQSSFLVAIDTSASMISKVVGLDINSNEVAKSIALYFSYLLKGRFANSYVEFDSKPVLKYWEGESPSDKYLKNTSCAYGSTNFLGIADLFIKIYNHTPIEKFPSGLICVSDGEFNSYGNNKSKTTFQLFKDKLLKAGFPKDYVDNFKIVLWDIPNTFYSRQEIRPKFESFADTPNFFYMGGFDPAGITFLLGGEEKDKPIPKTPRELFEAATSQEIMDYIQL